MQTKTPSNRNVNSIRLRPRSRRLLYSGFADKQNVLGLRRAGVQRRHCYRRAL